MLGWRYRLDWPEPVLSPNNRAHWRVKRAAIVRAREGAAYDLLESRASGPPRGWLAPLHLCYVTRPATRHSYDLDNFASMMKAGLDGLAKALQFNDRLVRRLTVEPGDPAPAAHVEVYLLPRDQDGAWLRGVPTVSAPAFLAPLTR
jgi:hypothetical protein